MATAEYKLTGNTVAATVVPTTTLYGSYSFVCLATGRAMFRGFYCDEAGRMTGDKVPAEIWGEAVAMMEAHNDEMSRDEEARRQAALEAQMNL